MKKRSVERRPVWAMVGMAAAVWTLALPPLEAEEIAGSTASDPQRVVLSLHDQGFAWVSEMRRITPASGLNRLLFNDVPRGLDPASLTLIPLRSDAGLSLREQRFRDDLPSIDTVLHRYLGQPIEVHAGGDVHQGRLLKRFGDEGLLLGTDGTAQLFLQASAIDFIQLPDASARLALQPRLEWLAEVEREGPQSVRLSYRLDGIHWQADYDMIMAPDGQTAYLGVRIGLDNRSQARYEDAQIQLIVTERGQVQAETQRAAQPRATRASGTVSPPLRYAYGATTPSFAETIAGSAGQVTYSLRDRLTLVPGERVHVHFAQVVALPIERFFVYDGVLFDRFQRPRRNDWNYGTESHSVVEAHVQFANERAEGLGVDLPPGRFRLYQQRADGALDWVGEDQVLPISAGEPGHVRLGPARGLRGERERVGYTEITPMRVYEESFQITLENHTEDTAEIRVVEHLYRWHDFEIVRADAEYEQVNEQTIEFRTSLRPGGRRTIHYTVRYSW